MSKGLEALKETAMKIVEVLYGKEEPLRNNKINELLETKQFKIIEKELKALEIIKEKEVAVFVINDTSNFDEYNIRLLAYGTNQELTQEEYDLLKEVLQDD